jgi:hypothetical protein
MGYQPNTSSLPFLSSLPCSLRIPLHAHMHLSVGPTSRLRPPVVPSVMVQRSHFLFLSLIAFFLFIPSPPVLLLPVFGQPLIHLSTHFLFHFMHACVPLSPNAQCSCWCRSLNILSTRRRSRCSVVRSVATISMRARVGACPRRSLLVRSVSPATRYASVS